MLSLRAIAFAAVLAAANLVAAQDSTATASGVEQPSAAPTLGTDTVHGCYSSGGELVLNATVKYNSQGACTTICRGMNKAVGASTQGAECYCGDKYPPKDTQVKDTECNIPCPGFGYHACGGIETFTIYNTGLQLVVKESEDSAIVSSSTGSVAPTSTSSAAPSIVTVSGTVVVTQSSAADNNSKSSGGGTNTVGIAVGVVVGLVAVAGILGGIFFYMRHKRNREIEEEHRRNAAVNAFISGSKPPSSSGGISMTDSRMDPVIANRRLSTGSIADNEDYSRRILRVTNA